MTVQPAEDWSDPEAKAQQIRSKQTYENLVSATLELMKEKPFEQITVVDIAEKANCSPGTINRRFGSKEKLVDVAYEQFAGRASSALDEVLDAIDFSKVTLSGFLDLLLSAYQAFVGEYQLIFRAGFTQVLAKSDSSAKIMRMRASVVTRIAHAASQTQHNVQHPDPQKAIEFAVLMGMAVLTELIEGGDLLPHIKSLDEKTVIEQLKISMLRYLGEET